MNVTLIWALPTTRTSNRPLAPADIQHVVVDVSADNGESWAPVGVFPPDVLSTRVTDLDFGTWLFRGVVVPVRGLPSAPLTVSVVNADDSPPNVLLSLMAVPE
jgi:hypothetical protein